MIHDQDLMRRIALERADAVRQALESAARKLEQQVAADAYMSAFKKAAKLIREMKPT